MDFGGRGEAGLFRVHRLALFAPSAVSKRLAAIFCRSLLRRGYLFLIMPPGDLAIPHLLSWSKKQV